LNSFLPSAKALYNFCHSSDDAFRDVAEELKHLFSDFEQAKGLLKNGHLDHNQQAILADNLSQSRKILDDLQQLKFSFEKSNNLLSEPVNEALFQQFLDLMGKIRSRGASIN
jgi:hypothetical protein